MFKQDIDNEQAKCYLERYPDLSQALTGLDAAKRHWRQFGHKEKRNKHCMADMDDEMAQCYLSRYSDVVASGDATQEEAAKDHWFRWGYFEGRHPYCAKPITSYQARCYLNKYPDLQQAFGMDIDKARNHWYTFGAKENRDPTCKSEGPKYCGENGEMCACHGTVHLTRWQSSSVQSSAKSATWEQAAGFLV